MDVVGYDIFHILLCNSPRLGMNIFIALTLSSFKTNTENFISLIKQFAM